MRVLTLTGALIALPLLTAAAQNNWTDQAQRLLNPNGGGQNAYERGRQDQARQEQYNRDERRAARQDQRARDLQYGQYRDPQGYARGRDPYYDR